MHLVAGELEITLCSRVRAGETCAEDDGVPCPRCLYRLAELLR